MDIRSAIDTAPVPEHNGTVPVWYFVGPQEMRGATEGGFLELINEWELPGGGAVYAHSHPTHEYYYILSGRGIMTIGDEEATVTSGDLVYIPPDAMHSLRTATPHAPIRGLCFAVGVRGIGKIEYGTH